MQRRRQTQEERSGQVSRFLSERFGALRPYEPGEQPRDRQYIKLNTNESPFGLPFSVRWQAFKESVRFRLYPDPECRKLRDEISSLFGVDKDEVMLTNGSDEALNFIFMSLCPNGGAFPDITYGFYPVFAKLNGVDYREIPLADDFSIRASDYLKTGRSAIIANPNALTGMKLPLDDISRIAQSNPNNVVVVDEAYVDFGTQSAVSLVKKHDNLIVVQTFSKSRFMAGLRLGVVFANRELIRDLNTIRYSVNPYNVNSAALAVGKAILGKDEYRKSCSEKIIEAREWTKAELSKMGFEGTDSFANFIFVKSNRIDGKELYLKLKETGILIRHFDNPRICQYNRITIGSMKQMKALVRAIGKILEV